MSVDEFHNRDDEYLAWLAEHSAGYVLNVLNTRRGDAKLHSAACRTICYKSPFTHPYIKVCSAEMGGLERWVADHPDASLSRCGRCQPPEYIGCYRDSSAPKQSASVITEVNASPVGGFKFEGPDAESRSVRLWADRYIPFERLSDAQKDARAELRRRVGKLDAEPDEILDASYAGSKPSNMDIENLVLYNIDVAAGGCFNLSTRNGVRFEMAHALHGVEVSGSPFGCSYEYELTDPASDFSYWRPVRSLAHFTDAGLGQFRAAKRLEQVWFAIHHAAAEIAEDPIAPTERFAIRLAIGSPEPKAKGANPELVKGLIDGTVAAFQYHRDRASVDEIVGRLARTTGKPSGVLKRLLLAEHHAVLGGIDNLVYRRGVAGVQWNPADHLLMAAQVVCRPASDDQWTLSGEIDVVEPRL